MFTNLSSITYIKIISNILDKNILIFKSMRRITLSPVAKLDSVYIVICRVIQTDRVSQIPGNTDTDTVM